MMLRTLALVIGLSALCLPAHAQRDATPKPVAPAPGAAKPQGGVVRPPDTDPAITVPPPQNGAGRVIPPPGTTGRDPTVIPK